MFGFESPIVYILTAFFAAAISMVLVLYLLPRRHLPSTGSLQLLMGSVAIWAFCYGMELSVFTNDDHHLMWSFAWIENSGPVPTLAYHRGPGL